MKTLMMLGALILIATPAAAESQREERHVTVLYSDLDLTRSAGADAMIARLRMAANKACGPRATELAERARRQICVRDAMDGGVRTLASPLVTARHASPNRPAVLAAK